jgi:hypothetical protein
MNYSQRKEAMAEVQAVKDLDKVKLISEAVTDSV